MVEATYECRRFCKELTMLENISTVSIHSCGCCMAIPNLKRICRKDYVLWRVPIVFNLFMGVVVKVGMQVK